MYGSEFCFSTLGPSFLLWCSGTDIVCVWTARLKQDPSGPRRITPHPFLWIPHSRGAVMRKRLTPQRLSRRDPRSGRMVARVSPIPRLPMRHEQERL